MAYPTQPGTPILGVSYDDALAFLRWRNRRAEEAGERWRYDLPTELEWERAAGGADGRAFPWGRRFDPSLCSCRFHDPATVFDGAGGLEARDASPFDVLDMAGSRVEWVRCPDCPEHSSVVKGGAWNYYDTFGDNLRIGDRFSASRRAANGSYGFRLVARPADG